MIMKFARLALAILPLAHGIAAAAAADGGATTSFLRSKEQIGTDILAKLLEKIESLEADLAKTKEDFGARIDDLEDTIEILQSHSDRRRLQSSDPECVFTYNAADAKCHTNTTFMFEQHVDMTKGFTSGGTSEFEGGAILREGADITGGMLVSYVPTMLKSGLDVQGGMVFLNSTTKVGNTTVDGITFVGKATFMDPAEFKDTVEFMGDAEFDNDVHFQGEGEVEFYVDVTFMDDVRFNDDAEFRDDVAIKGPTTSDSRDESSTDFKIMGYVNVDFKQKLEMDVYPVTRFRDDVELVHGDSTTSETSRTTTSSYDDDSRDSGDYSSESHDTIPQLLVDGDITTFSDLIVEGDLEVQGTSLFGDGVTFEGDIDASDVTWAFGDLVSTGLTVANGDITVTGGDISVAGGDVRVSNGDVTVTAGADGGSIELTNGDITVRNGDVQLVANGNLGPGDFIKGTTTLTVP